MTPEETDLRFEVDMSAWNIPASLKYFIQLGNLEVQKQEQTKFMKELRNFTIFFFSGV
jgi:hypothetical protein